MFVALELWLQGEKQPESGSRLSLGLSDTF